MTRRRGTTGQGAGQGAGQGERLGLAAALAGLILLTAAFVVGLSAPRAAAQANVEMADTMLLAAR